ncbi:pyroglutamyl-peptidase 1 [Sergentomyia squamirostris]
MDKKVICLTGFGPFAGNESCNASWEAVKRLPEEITVKNHSFRLEKLEVPVMYTDVDKTVPEIWKQDPILVIHCGVHGSTDKILLEKCAFKNCYGRPDWDGKCLPTSSADLCGHGQNCDRLETKFNVDKIAEELNQGKGEPLFETSTDVGSYLCGYIYVKSLDFSLDKTLFIHVPKEFIMNPTVVKQGILDVVHKCLDQIL